MVLIDLGNFSGFYEVTSPQEHSTLAYREGMRAVFARIFNFVHFTPEEQAHVIEMVRLERQADDIATQGQASDDRGLGTDAA